MLHRLTEKKEIKRMRDFASCFSEHAVKVSDSSCSGSSSGGSKSSIIVTAADSSVQTAVTSLYRCQLSSQKDLLIKITWSKTHLGPTLSLGLDDDPYNHHWNASSIASQLLRKRKGTRSYLSGNNSLVVLYWDYLSAKFSSGPEPVSSFYVVIVVDSELALFIGDLSEEFIKKSEDMLTIGEFSLVSRREQVLGRAVYSTKARFGNEGKDHDIVIRCKGDGWQSADSELVVSVDRKRVVQVKSLQWNFRGNQTVFIDGSPVDMMWDVRDWWFSNPQGFAVFMFRKRSALESRLWFEEEMLQRERGISGFSLLIQAFKNS